MQSSVIATLLAKVFAETAFHQHRGYLVVSDGDGMEMFGTENVVVIFGNDGWTDERAKEEVLLIREHIALRGGEELAFGTCDEEYTWCLIARLQDREDLGDVIVASADESGYGNAHYQGCAVGAI